MHNKLTSVILSTGVTMFMGAAILVVALYPHAGRVEGKLWPVVTSVKMTDVVMRTVDGVPTLYIGKIRFHKRGCDMLGLRWRVGDVSYHVDFTADTNLDRGPGWHSSTNWVVRGVRSLEASTVVAVHRCHFLWKTLTEFYP